MQQCSDINISRAGYESLAGYLTARCCNAKTAGQKLGWAKNSAAFMFFALHMRKEMASNHTASTSHSPSPKLSEANR